MSIREYAKANGHEIIGKLTRHPEWEYEEQWDGSKKRKGYRAYSDEGGNDYYVGKAGCSIVTEDGAVI